MEKSKAFEIEMSSEGKYATELARISDILKERISEEEATELLYEIENIAREQDKIVGKILSDERVVKKYDVEHYDGYSLNSREGYNYQESVMHNGDAMLKNIVRGSVFTEVFLQDHRFEGRFLKDKFLEWFRENVKYSKMRLEQLDKTNDISLTGLKGINTKYLDDDARIDDDPKKEPTMN